MAWTRKKLRRKARKAAKAERPLSFNWSAATERLFEEMAALSDAELEAAIPVPDDDGPGGTYDVDLDA